jgi:hypothetical protein
VAVLRFLRAAVGSSKVEGQWTEFEKNRKFKNSEVGAKFFSPVRKLI